MNVSGLTVASLGAMCNDDHSLAVAALAPETASLPPQTVGFGEPFAFTAVVTDGDGPFAYQWQLDGMNIIDATNATYGAASATLADAGLYTIRVAGFLGSSTRNTFLTVLKAVPTVTAWPTGTSILYGQTLTSSTLSGGSAAIAGLFAFATPALAPDAGTTNVWVTFTPTDTNNYTAVSNWVAVAVNKDTPALTMPSAGDITYGQTLALSALAGGAATNGTSGAAVAGTFDFAAPALAPDTGTTNVWVTFTPTDTNNYTAASNWVAVAVNKDTPALTMPSASAITYGQTLASSTLTGGAATNGYSGAAVAGTFAFASSALAPVVGTTNVWVVFTPTDTENYTAASNGVVVAVNKAVPTVTTWPTATPITVGQTLAASILSGGASSVPGTFAFRTPSFAPTNTALQSVTFTPTNTLGYASVTGSVSVTVFHPVMISIPPENQLVANGDPVTVSVTAQGDAPLGYQWFKDGVRLVAQTNATLRFAAFGITNSGSYAVMVTNPRGMALSIPALLSVSNATLLAWGCNSFGELGVGNTFSTNLPATVTSNVVAVAGGENHSLFVKAGGTLWAMGYNSFGRLGDGTFSRRAVPVYVTNGVAAVAAGANHSLFVKTDGTLWAMGANDYGQLGEGSTVSWRAVPVFVTNGVAAVAAGANHSLFVKTDGTLWAMGANDYGQLGIGTNADANRPVRVPGLTVASLGSMCNAYHSLVVALQAPLTANLTVWSEHGTTWPATGTNTYAMASVLTNTVISPDTMGTTQYVCTGWSLMGNMPTFGTGTCCVVTLTNNAVLTWTWQTNYWLTVMTNGQGSVTNAASGWKPANAACLLYPIANFGNTFNSWTVNDTNWGAGEPLTLVMDGAKEVSAGFVPCFVDVTTTLDWNMDWAFNPRLGYFLGTLTLANPNDSPKSMLAPFWYEASSNAYSWLKSPTGIDTNTGLAYLDISAAVNRQLPAIGDGDLWLDPGESVTVTNILLMGRRTPDTSLVVAIWADPPGVLGLADSDGDGTPDADEYVAGTLATDAASVFRIRLGADSRSVQWDAQKGRLYTVYACTNLVQGFTPIAEDIEGAGVSIGHRATLLEMGDDGGGNDSPGAVFYRVRVRVKGVSK